LSYAVINGVDDTGKESRVTGRRGRTDRTRPSVRREVAKFVASGLVAVLLFIVASLPFLRHVGRSEAIREARATARLAAVGVVEPNLEDAVLEHDRAALARIDRIVQERILSDTIVRVKLWSADGRILYSDEPRLIGMRFGLEADERDAFETGNAFAEVSDLSKPENRFERPEGELLEVYSRVRTPNGTPVLFEVYQRFESVTASGARIWRSFLPAMLATLLLLWLVQAPLAYRLARRVREGHEEREVLLRRALDASTAERRRIAADLHDSVVQDLAGISYSLAAAAETPEARADPRLRATLREAASVTRASMQRLRSLLVSIHPLNLRTSGLNAAIADLVAPLERLGMDVDVDVPQRLDLDAEAETLVFRTVREAIRNIAEHANATHVSVRLRRSNGTVLLAVEDDGVGFDRGRREERREAGHVGLSLLEELAEDADARIEVRSEAGAGTSVKLELPA
jgi:two-component system NarL family sensor kinase